VIHLTQIQNKGPARQPPLITPVIYLEQRRIAFEPETASGFEPKIEEITAPGTYDTCLRLDKR
jgi:hypothetical protein